MLRQSGPFANSSLNAVGIAYTMGLSSTLTGNQVDVGVFTPSNGSFTYTGDEIDADTFFVGITQSGTYNVASNGRTTFTTGSAGAPVAYLVSPNKAFVLYTDGKVEGGFLEPQTAGPFTNASTHGTYFYGITNPVAGGTPNEVGVVTFDGVSVDTGVQDDNIQGTLIPGSAYSMTYSVSSNGKGVTPVSNPVNIFYVLSPTKLVLYVATGDAYPYLEVEEQ